MLYCQAIKTLDCDRAQYNALDLGELTPIRTPLGKEICNMAPTSLGSETFASTNSVVIASLRFNFPDQVLKEP